MKTTTIHCVIAAKSASDRLSGMNPPAGSVANAVETASNGPIRSIEPREADERQDRRHGRRESDVEQPEPPGGRPDPVGELVDLRPRELRLEQLPSSDPEPRQDGEREHDDSHAAEPLRELAPHQEALVDGVDVDDDRCARRREAGHGLEQRVHGPVELGIAREQEGQRAEAGGEAATSARRRGTPRANRRGRGCHPRGARARVPTSSRDRSRGEERPERLSVAECDRGREQRREAEVAQERPAQAERRGKIDRKPRRAPRVGCRRPGQLSQDLLDVRDARCLGEHDHPVAREERRRRCVGTPPARP